jgi:hypothetical protein
VSEVRSQKKSQMLLATPRLENPFGNSRASLAMEFLAELR